MWRNIYFNRPRRRSPMLWQEMRRLQRDMERLMGTTPGPIRSKFPAMNVWASENGLMVSAEVPGLDPEAIDISVVGDTLTLSGSRQREETPEDTRYHRRERSMGEFSRTFELPYRVDAEQVEARFRNGVLHISLPRLAQDMPKKIEIKSA